MTRFDLDMDGSMEPSEHGRWVRYEDAQRTWVGLTDEKWQPIETAPHYETILIWQPKYQRLALSINDGFQYKHATHWMPLPAPPTEAAHGIKEKTND